MSDFGSEWGKRQQASGSRQAQNKLAVSEHRAFANEQVQDIARKWGPGIGGLYAMAFALAGEPVWQTAKSWSKFHADPNALMDHIAEIPSYAISKIIPKPIGDYIVDKVEVLRYNPELASEYELIDTMPQTAAGAWEGLVKGTKDWWSGSDVQHKASGGLARYQLHSTKKLP